MATRRGVCLSKFIPKAYNVEGLKSWGVFLVLILVSLGCILYQQIGNNVPLTAYCANFIREYQKKV